MDILSTLTALSLGHLILIAVVRAFIGLLFCISAQCFVLVQPFFC